MTELLLISAILIVATIVFMRNTERDGDEDRLLAALAVILLMLTMI